MEDGFLPVMKKRSFYVFAVFFVLMLISLGGDVAFASSYTFSTDSGFDEDDNPVQIGATMTFVVFSNDSNTANIGNGTDVAISNIDADGEINIPLYVMNGDEPCFIRNIAPNAFNRLDITSVTATNVLTNIGDNAFIDCASLESVSLPGVSGAVGKYAFSNCDSLTSISLPNAGDLLLGVFDGCDNLADVYLPNVSVIRKYAFSNCDSLVSISLPLAANVYEYAFSSCSALKSVIMPEVQSIEDKAFNGCAALESVYVGKNFGDITGGGNIPPSATIYHPSGATGWPDGSKSAYVILNLLIDINLSGVSIVEAEADGSVAGNYSAILSVGNGYELPPAITVTVGNSVLTQAEYTYSQTTGTLSIPAALITDNIKLEGEAVIPVPEPDPQPEENDEDKSGRSIIDSSKIITRSISKSGIEMKGKIAGNARLVVEDIMGGAYSTSYHGNLIKALDISLTGDYDDEIEITFNLGLMYAGQSITIVHVLNGVEEIYTTTADENGKATIGVKSLSPFYVYVGAPMMSVPDALTVDPPKTGDALIPVGVALMVIAAIGMVIMRRKSA